MLGGAHQDANDPLAAQPTWLRFLCSLSHLVQPTSRSYLCLLNGCSTRWAAHAWTAHRSSDQFPVILSREVM